MPPKVGNVADALKQQAEKRPGGREPTVRLRVLPNHKGFYGHPVPGIIPEGVEFNHRVKDLEVFKKGMLNYGGKPVQTIEVKGVVYAIPAWCEDAKHPKAAPAEDEDETFALSEADASEM